VLDGENSFSNGRKTGELSLRSLMQLRLVEEIPAVLYVFVLLLDPTDNGCGMARLPAFRRETRGALAARQSDRERVRAGGPPTSKSQ